jgi:hypothetical protein
MRSSQTAASTAIPRDERLDELDRRIEPHQIARALSQDARKRGV